MPHPVPDTFIRIASTATALPPHEITREDVKRYFGSTFAIDERRLNAMMAVVDNSQVRRRFFIHPVDHIIEPRPLSELTRDYREHAIRLGREVAEAALRNADMTPADVDLIVTVSCTGVMIPSLDAHLMNMMGFRPETRRLPITELGCAAGAAAVARAGDFVRAYPGSTVLVVAVELPSLTFQRRDTSQANLISTILFGDGAAAAVVTGRPGGGPRMLESASYLLPDSIDAMGFDLQDDGFHIVLSKDVPQLIRERIRSIVGATLAKRSLQPGDVAAYVLHPGGQRLLQAVQEELGLTNDDTAPSWNVLRECGNQSSASVLFVLDEWRRTRRVPKGAPALMAAFGPGFSAETVLQEWD
jgi:alkylresorcinol/alkylpyrone synthase